MDTDDVTGSYPCAYRSRKCTVLWRGGRLEANHGAAFIREANEIKLTLSLHRKISRARYETTIPGRALVTDAVSRAFIEWRRTKRYCLKDKRARPGRVALVAFLR